MKAAFLENKDRLPQPEKLGDPPPRLDGIRDLNALRTLLKVIHQNQRKSKAACRPQDVAGVQGAGAAAI
jgi:hypothetical protein